MRETKKKLFFFKFSGTIHFISGHRSRDICRLKSVSGMFVYNWGCLKGVHGSMPFLYPNLTPKKLKFFGTNFLWSPACIHLLSLKQCCIFWYVLVREMQAK